MSTRDASDRLELLQGTLDLLILKTLGTGELHGLGISRRIVAKHGGELRCESIPGRTCFEVRLPIHALEAHGT